MGFGGAEPSAEEAAIIDATAKLSVAKCVGEGLSEAQAQCILTAEGFRGLGDMAKCPAIRDERPSWLQLPPPGAFEPPPPPGEAAGAAEDGGEERGAGAPPPE